MKSNFEFLNRYWPALAQIGAAAESYVYSDANACLYKLGMFGERLILEIFAFEHIKEPTIDNTHANRIRLLKREGLIPKKIDDILYALRKTRNDAVHAGADSVEDAKTLLSMTYNLAVWFMEVYGDWGYIAPAFVMPENVVQPDYESIIKEQEEKIVALSKQVDAVSTAASSKTSKERAEKGETASESMDLSEAETRYLIDEQFRKFGWEADTNNLRYSRGTRPQKGRNLAIAEWPTDSTVGKNGYADYALFVGLKLVGIVEAKKAAIDIPSVIDHQCKEYAKGIKAEHKDYVIGQWGAYKVPFVFATVLLELLFQKVVIGIADHILQKVLLLYLHSFEPQTILVQEFQILVHCLDTQVDGLGLEEFHQIPFVGQQVFLVDLIVVGMIKIDRPEIGMDGVFRKIALS